MPHKIKKEARLQPKKRRTKTKAYVLSENPIEFYISEETDRYRNNKPFNIYYDNPTHLLWNYMGFMNYAIIYSVGFAMQELGY